MVGVFLEWWGRQLWSLLPARLRGERRTAEMGDAVLLSLIELRPGQRPAIDAARRRGGRDTQLGRFSLDDAGLVNLRASLGAARRGVIRLILPPPLPLEQHVTLPLAAERGLQTALRWEMDRLTPFPADAVFWSWVIEQRDRAHARLKLRLRLVPKAAVAATIEALAAAGLSPTMLAAASDPTLVIPLSGPAPHQRSTWALRAASALFAATVIAAIATPFLRQELAARQVAARTEALRPDVDLAEGFRRRLTERAASADIVAAEAARVGNTLRILAAITEVLPDDTSLFSITLRDRALTLTGQSASAARLIPALAADPAFRDPVFAAPVTRNEFTGAEAFTIRTELRP